MVIDATETFNAVECIVRCDIFRAIVCSRGHQHTFMLMEGEYIERLHTRMLANAVVSLKISTNLRSSQWFGDGICVSQREGLELLDEIAARRGYYFSNLFGSHSSECCNHLGCTFESLTRSSRIDLIQVTLSDKQSNTEANSIKMTSAGCSLLSYNQKSSIHNIRRLIRTRTLDRHTFNLINDFGRRSNKDQCGLDPKCRRLSCVFFLQP